MKIYLDCCCYNRPFDDLTQERIRIESEAIISILNRSQSGEIEICAGEVLDAEINRITLPHKKQRVKELYELSYSHYIKLNDNIELRAAEIRNQSKIQAFDSLHIASAEDANADIMLTTDDKLERMASQLQLYVNVMNPLRFIMNYIYGGDYQ